MVDQLQVCIASAYLRKELDAIELVFLTPTGFEVSHYGPGRSVPLLKGP